MKQKYHIRVSEKTINKLRELAELRDMNVHDAIAAIVDNEYVRHIPQERIPESAEARTKTPS